MIYLVNTYSKFTLDCVVVEELYFLSFLEGIVKDSIKFLY